MSQRKPISLLLHPDDPYGEFDASPYSLDLQGWSSEHPIFERAISTLKPKTIIEVGTWKGASAIHMAKLLQQFELDCEIVCIDTFLGSHDHWLSSDWEKQVKFKDGRPDLYNQFLANVVLTGFTDVITPLPISSSAGGRVLHAKGMAADIVYIDASHTYYDVKRDLETFWELVRPGGMLLGDDFLPMWHEVIRAVSEFVEEKRLSMNLRGEKYWFRKAKAGRSL